MVAAACTMLQYGGMHCKHAAAAAASGAAMICVALAGTILPKKRDELQSFRPTKFAVRWKLSAIDSHALSAACTQTCMHVKIGTAKRADCVRGCKTCNTVSHLETSCDVGTWLALFCDLHLPSPNQLRRVAH